MFNTPNYVNPALDELTNDARFEKDPAKYDALIAKMNAIAMDDVPRIPVLTCSRTSRCRRT